MCRPRWDGVFRLLGPGKPPLGGIKGYKNDG
jgi:hypothetical protein